MLRYAQGDSENITRVLNQLNINVAPRELSWNQLFSNPPALWTPSSKNPNINKIKKTQEVQFRRSHTTIALLCSSVKHHARSNPRKKNTFKTRIKERQQNSPKTHKKTGQNFHFSNLVILDVCTSGIEHYTEKRETPSKKRTQLTNISISHVSIGISRIFSTYIVH